MKKGIVNKSFSNWINQDFLCIIIKSLGWFEIYIGLEKKRSTDTIVGQLCTTVQFLQYLSFVQSDFKEVNFEKLLKFRLDYSIPDVNNIFNTCVP